jgi:hypothetical protein
MPDATDKTLGSRAFYDRLEMQLAEARTDLIVLRTEAEARIVAKIAADHLTAATESQCPEAVLQAIRDVAWVNLDPITKVRCTALDTVLNAIGINSLKKLMASDGRWISRIGAHGRLILDESLLLELHWKHGDSLLLVKEESDYISVRRVVRVKSPNRASVCYSVPQSILSV